MFIAHIIDTKLVDSFLYLQFDFIRSLECAIINECNCKIIYGEDGIFINKANIRKIGYYS